MRTWLTGILTGLLYGVLFALATRYLITHHWTSALIAGAATGIPFGIVMTVVQRRTKALFASLPGDLTRQQRGRAVRASRRGPVPADPAVRAAALEFARRQLERYQTRWMRVLLVVLPILFVLTAVSNLLGDDRSWWRAVPQLAAAVAFTVMAFEPRRLRRRIALLTFPGGYRPRRVSPGGCDPEKEELA
ncbi:hypothetical protein [Kribbella sp. NPDC051620]|uniref:hypothetical protein n=1 Tax=Kribbella sp. NPDC051620 TaxID=3364120 RepID=UPI0037BD2E1B